MMRRFTLLFSLPLLTVSTVTVAQEAPVEDAAPKAEAPKTEAPQQVAIDLEDLPKVHLEFRATESFLSDFPVDAEGHTLGQEGWLDTRLRVSFEQSIGTLSMVTEWDIFSGQFAGDTWNVPASSDERHRDQFAAMNLRGIVPRRLSFSGKTSAGAWEAGLVTSHWGLGMVANNGAEEPLFGRSDFGDRVFRLRFTTLPFKSGDKPFPLYLTAAVDQVMADDMALLSEQQLATQGILSVLYRSKELETGLYGVFRHQWEVEASRTTTAGMIDGYLSAPLALGDNGWKLTLAAEAAGILGNTNRATTYNATDRVDVLSGGATLQTSLAAPEDMFIARFHAGWASGDANPDSTLSTDFTFDRDYAVGMVLFDQVMGGVEAATHALLSDPQYSGQPPDGVEALTTEGAFRRAAYAQPILQFKLNSDVNLRVGTLVAVATAPIAQPFYSYRAGGVPTTHHNLASSGDYLGTELNWAVESHRPWPNQTTQDDGLTLLVSGGHAFLSSDLAGEGPARVDLFMLMARARY